MYLGKSGGKGLIPLPQATPIIDPSFTLGVAVIENTYSLAQLRCYFKSPELFESKNGSKPAPSAQAETGLPIKKTNFELGLQVPTCRCPLVIVL